MKSLFFRSLIAAILLGPAISFVSQVVSFLGGIKYEPPVTEAERQQMGNLTINEWESTFAKRKVKMTRWDWLRDSVPYSYYWKQVAFNATVPSSGVFLGCMWVGWMQERRARRLKPTTTT